MPFAIPRKAVASMLDLPSRRPDNVSRRGHRTWHPPTDLARIFEPFFRGSQPADDGTGLGLSIVKRIAERLGGSVILENIASPDRSGLRATVKIPAVADGAGLNLSRSQ
jgi:signal transduction histidine kinase